MKIKDNELVSRLMSRKFVDSLLQYSERELFIPGIWADVGFKQKAVITEKSFDGESSYTLSKRLTMAVDAVTSFSTKPLQFIFYLGLLISMFSVFFAIYLIINKIFFGVDTNGWTSILTSLYLIGGIIIFSIGTVGLYLSRIFPKLKDAQTKLLETFIRWEINMSNNQPSKGEVLEANIEVHSALANSGEYNQSPHFRAENQARVRAILKSLVEKIPSKSESRLLDMGCGTGFIVHLAADLVSQIEGVDITSDMMRQVDLSKGNINLQIAEAENVPFKDNSFDLVTAYSFMDHLLDYRLVIDEAYRVLKEGGIFYSDLNPNRGFSSMLKQVESAEFEVLPHAISREIKGMLHNGEYYKEEFGLSEEMLTKAEPEKSFNHGFDAQEVSKYARELGFTKVEIQYDWFLGQGVLMNSNTELDLLTVDQYLQKMLPASGGFFKYLRFVFVK